MRKPASVLAAAILVLGAVPSVMAADYWVANGGNDSTGDGSGICSNTELENTVAKVALG